MKPGEVSDLPSEALGREEPKLCALVPSSLCKIACHWKVPKEDMYGCVAIHWVISAKVFAPVEKIMLRKKKYLCLWQVSELHGVIPWQGELSEPACVSGRSEPH